MNTVNDNGSGRQLKVAHLFQAPGIRFSEPQAAQLHIYHTMRGLQDAGHRVALVALQADRKVLVTECLDVFRKEQQQSASFGRLGFSGTRPFKIVESAIRRTQKELHLPYFGFFDSLRMYDACRQNLAGYDLLHERFNLLAIGGALASKRMGIPLILEVNADLLQQRKFRGAAERGFRRLFAKWATRVVFRTAAKIICISSDLRDHLRSTWEIEPSKLTVLPCAADTEAFGNNNHASLARRRLGLGSELVVIWVGGFYEWHALDLLITSFANVIRQFPATRLVLVGDGETRPQVERHVAKLGLQKVVIMTGAVPHTRVPEILSVADIAVAPAPPIKAANGGTGTPLKLFEYMAAGKPIVATSVGQAAAVIQDRETGILVEPNNAVAFANAIMELLGNPERSARLGQNARQLAVERHSWKQYTRRLEQIYASKEIRQADHALEKPLNTVGTADIDHNEPSAQTLADSSSK